MLPSSMTEPDRTRVAALRRFNRFHTRLVGALSEGLLDSDLPLAQARVLYEIAQAPASAPASAAGLGRGLGLDAGYLSRLIAALETRGLVTRRPSAQNARRLDLVLTEAGRAAFAALDRASESETAALIAPLAEPDQIRLLAAMARVEALLGGAPDDPVVVLREPEPGDLGWIVHRQGLLYAREYGWDARFEALVAEIVGRFGREHDPARERAWVAEQGGAVVGSVFLVRQDEAVAKLRLLYVEPSARGQGLGRRLVEECLRFSRARGYRRIELWTNDVLVSARRLYQAAGFALVSEEPHHSFGRDLVAQTWGRDLRGPAPAVVPVQGGGGAV